MGGIEFALTVCVAEFSRIPRFEDGEREFRDPFLRIVWAVAPQCLTCHVDVINPFLSQLRTKASLPKVPKVVDVVVVSDRTIRKDSERLGQDLRLDYRSLKTSEVTDFAVNRQADLIVVLEPKRLGLFQRSLFSEIGKESPVPVIRHSSNQGDTILFPVRSPRRTPSEISPYFDALKWFGNSITFFYQPSEPGVMGSAEWINNVGFFSPNTYTQHEENLQVLTAWLDRCEDLGIRARLEEDCSGERRTRALCERLNQSFNSFSTLVLDSDSLESDRIPRGFLGLARRFDLSVCALPSVYRSDIIGVPAAGSISPA